MQRNSSVNDSINLQNVQTLAKSYLMYKIGKCKVIRLHIQPN